MGLHVLEILNDMSGLPGKVVIPFEQEVYATFISEKSRYTSDLGWMLYADAIDASGEFRGWDTIDERNKHIIFRHVVDNDVSDACCGNGDGILATDYGNGDFPIDSETGLFGYADGSGTTFLIDRDGRVTPRDMKKRIGRFAAGSEIVFFLATRFPGKSAGVFQQALEPRFIYSLCTARRQSPMG